MQFATNLYQEPRATAPLKYVDMDPSSPSCYSDEGHKSMDNHAMPEPRPELRKRSDRRPSSSRRQRSLPSARHERYIYTYRLAANSTPMQFLISCVISPSNVQLPELAGAAVIRPARLTYPSFRVEPEFGKTKPGKYIFRLSFKANGVERSLGEPTAKTLRVNPRELDFIVL